VLDVCRRCRRDDLGEGDSVGIPGKESTELTICRSDFECRFAVKDCADCQDDLLHSNLPGALQNLRSVWIVFLCARIDAIKDLVSQIGSNICGKNNENIFIDAKRRVSGENERISISSRIVECCRSLLTRSCN
jgi:hypothetical protein